ncbi:MAG: hypothetical protein L0Y70_10810 [Gemmataceae bacterium]|nr:hypothetical protein [Gemmataceae bacterium]
MTSLVSLAGSVWRLAEIDASASPESESRYGTNEQRITRMQQAFTNIMQSGVLVTLIE